MAIMKKGTNVGLDADFQNVKVGDAIPDRVLALELRRRGYEVKATKMIEL